MKKMIRLHMFVLGGLRIIEMKKWDLVLVMRKRVILQKWRMKKWDWVMKQILKNMGVGMVLVDPGRRLQPRSFYYGRLSRVVVLPDRHHQLREQRWWSRWWDPPCRCCRLVIRCKYKCIRAADLTLHIIKITLPCRHLLPSCPIHQIGVNLVSNYKFGIDFRLLFLLE